MFLSIMMGMKRGYQMGMVLVVCGVLWGMSATHVSAQNFSVSPFVIDYTVEPRDIISGSITVTNTGAQPISVYPTVNNVSVGAEGGIETFVSPSMSDRTTSLATWIEISRLATELAPGESKELPFTLNVHPTAQSGVYHAFVGFGTGRNRNDAEAMVMRGGTPGTIVNVTIEDNANEFLKLSRFLIDRFITQAEEGNISYIVENSGDTMLVPGGDIILYNRRGEEVGSVRVNEEGAAVAPGEKTSFTASVPMEGLLGKYKALLSVEYGTTQKASLNDTVYFYVLPWKKILIVFGVVLLIAILLSLFIHRRYFHDDDDDFDDADRVPLAVRDTQSASLAHDLDMKRS